MARPARPLTDKVIRDAIRGAGKRGLPLYDGRGLHLIDRDGRYYWRLKYIRPDGRENRLALGQYPEIPLAEARTLTEAARAKLRQGIDPAGEKKAARAAREAATERTFAIYGRKWLNLKTPGWSPVTARKNKRAVEAYLLPELGGERRSDVAAKAANSRNAKWR